MTKQVQGPLSGVTETYNSFFTGTIGVAFPAVAIYQEQMKCFQVIVQNSASSAATAYIGNALNGQYFELAAGESITIPINDLNKIHAGTAGGAATINFIAMT